MVKRGIHSFLNRIRRTRVPGDLARRQIRLDESRLKRVETSVREHYHRGWRSEEFYTPEAYAADLRDHVIARLEFDRIMYIPWFNDTVSLDGCNILEIGCGTGSSSIALAEQGARVTGIDVDDGALEVARERSDIYQVPATFISGNACDAWAQLRGQTFDLIIFFACLEHMTYGERIECLKKYYDLLPEGACLGIVETPNRLWYIDDHTSMLPFFHWLPDRLAYDYSKYSDIPNFKELYRSYSDESCLHFQRRGRGCSYHELEIALGMPARELQVAAVLHPRLIPCTLNYRYHKLLTRIHPRIDRGFFYPNIDIILRK